MSDLYAAAQTVEDAQSFGFFVRALRRQVDENAQSGPFQAENFDLGSVLETLSDWAETPGAQKINALNPWAAAAHVLLIGHGHE